MEVQSRVSTLGIIDKSWGPSGLSRYVELLWPALTDHFQVVVFGNPQGPYVNLPNARFIPFFKYIPPDDSGNAAESQETRGAETSIANGIRGRARTIWQSVAPGSVRYLAGFARNAWAIAQSLKTHRVDVAYIPVYGAESAVVGARLAGIRRVVGTFHMPPPESKNRVRRCAVSQTYRSLNAAIAVSQKIADDWVRFSPSQAWKTVVIPNMVLPLRLVPNRLRRRDEVLTGFGLPGDGRTVLVAVGRLTAQKGFIYLLDAIARLKPRYPTLTVAIAGEGPLASELAIAARRLGIEDNVRLLGQLPDVSSLLGAADGFVLSSISEAMPFALLEAMAYGLPIVATEVGGVPELVRHGETGILCPPGEPGHLADGIEMLLRSPDMAVRLGRAGREMIRSSYSVEVMSQSTLEVFRHGERSILSMSNKQDGITC